MNRLPENTVDVWVIDLQDPAHALDDYYRQLSDLDRTRADRFLVKTARRQLLVSHFATQRILRSYLGHDPQFEKADNGKPYLRDTNLAFNLSHSHEMALLALAWNAEIGVDVEYGGRSLELEAMAHRFFSAREYEELVALPEAQRQDAFFRIWTRKEAYIKAIGDGLRHPLDQFAVSLDSPAELYGCPGWTLLEVDVPLPYRAALVVPEGEWKTRNFAFRPDVEPEGDQD